VLKISAFLFAALIFLVTSLHQGKVVSRDYQLQVKTSWTNNLCYFRNLFVVEGSPRQPAGLRNCNAAAFASFKKYATHFLNSGKPGPNQKMRLMQLLCSMRRRI
jgi:hypothetical protein